ncbi:unnamed protein product [marine sediment metagenome]|uniref:Uncharacterized protein n=1 Tax=marine sediment metagenome TaxID=412755 RepID=X1VA46_9ZZZZ
MWILRIIFLALIIFFGWVAFKMYREGGNPIGECIIAGVFAGLWLLTEVCILAD